MSIDKSLWGESVKPKLFKIHTQDQSDLKIENYAEINSEDYFYNEDMKYDWFVVNSQGTCFYDKRYIRPSSGTRQYTIGQFIKGSTYGAGFVSSDKNDLYLTAIGGQENDRYLTITKLSDNGNGLQGEEVAGIATYFYEPNSLLSGETLPQCKLPRAITLRNISSEVGLIKYIFDVASFKRT